LHDLSVGRCSNNTATIFVCSTRFLPLLFLVSVYWSTVTSNVSPFMLRDCCPVWLVCP